ncbi:MAG: hypothetical protein GDA53_10620 [Rhodobacteraceae bacterium]|nr:hypothetical protein [Paracoccaceae bacterium]
MKKQMIGQGAGRFTPAERLERARPDTYATEDFPGDKLFLFGTTPVAAGVSSVAMLRSLVFFPISNPGSKPVLKRPVLSGYVARGRDVMLPPAEILGRAS